MGIGGAVAHVSHCDIHAAGSCVPDGWSVNDEMHGGGVHVSFGVDVECPDIGKELDVGAANVVLRWSGWGST